MAVREASGNELTVGLPPVRVGWWLRDIRRRAGVHEAEVVERLSITLRTLRRWESGSLIPNDAELGRLAELFGCSPGDLVPGRARVAIDRCSSTLHVGDHHRPFEFDSNESILRRYLALIREIRHLGPDEPVIFRHDDIAALADELDLSDSDLETQLIRVAGITAEHAGWVRRQLLRRRVVTPLLGLGTVAATAFGLTRVSTGTDSTPESMSTNIASTAVSFSIAGSRDRLDGVDETHEVVVEQLASVISANLDWLGVLAPELSSVIAVAASDIPATPEPTPEPIPEPIPVRVRSTIKPAVVIDALVITAPASVPESAPAPSVVSDLGDSEGSMVEVPAVG